MVVPDSRTQPECRLVQEIDEVQAYLQTINMQCGQHADGQGDEVDQASHTLDLAMKLTLRRSYEQRLIQLERACARLRTGQYEVCECCGAQIDPDRLEVMPGTTLCVSCQRRSEHRAGIAGGLRAGGHRVGYTASAVKARPRD